MVRLLAKIKIAIVRRDMDLTGLVIDFKIDAIAGLESKQLEVCIDDGHPRQVWPASLGLVRRAAEDHLKHRFRVLLLALTEQRFNMGDSQFRLLR
ncbi:hypothetical protein WS50_07120 [Burkholderia territorii]|nr:hypothetical protein WS47_06195 [Burkholderia territorii]KUZ21231.1 hypothetical protein WS50_07120 [Burkholderia territorii]